MGQDRFGSLFILNIKRDITNSIGTEVFVNNFSEKDRRIVLR